MPNEVELLVEWQKRLGLQDWLIELQTNVSPEEMDLQYADGCVAYEETVKAARIQTIDPSKRLETNTEEKIVCLRPFNFEEVLVHELLHLKFCLLEKGTNWEKKLQLRMLHQIIDDLSRALVNAKEYKNEK